MRMPWDSICSPEPETREETEELLQLVESQGARLAALGWDDIGHSRTYTDTLTNLAEIGCSMISTLDSVDRWYPHERVIEEARWRLQAMDDREAQAGRAILEQLPLGPDNPDTDADHPSPRRIWPGKTHASRWRTAATASGGHGSHTARTAGAEAGGSLQRRGARFARFPPRHPAHDTHVDDPKRAAGQSSSIRSRWS